MFLVYVTCFISIFAGEGDRVNEKSYCHQNFSSLRTTWSCIDESALILQESTHSETTRSEKTAITLSSHRCMFYEDQNFTILLFRRKTNQTYTIKQIKIALNI